MRHTFAAFESNQPNTEPNLQTVEATIAAQRKRLVFTVAGLGQVNGGELDNAVELANTLQDSFHFVRRPTLPIPRGDYWLSNGGRNLDAFFEALLDRPGSQRRLPAGNLIFVTAEPYSDEDAAKESGGRSVEADLNQCYFLDEGLSVDKRIAIVSTFIWDRLPPRSHLDVGVSRRGGRARRAQQAYLLYAFGVVAVNNILPSVGWHEETRGCPFDYCDDVRRIDEFFARGSLCPEHGRNFVKAMNAGRISREQLNSLLTLFNRGAGRLYDVFVAYASEDRERVAEPLVAALRSRGLTVWYDRDALAIGDSLDEKIDEGLQRCRFGIVVLSRAFFAKPWPQEELRRLGAKEIASGPAILPIWHRINRSFVAKRSLKLADRVAGTTDEGIDKLADKLWLAVRGLRAI